MTQTEAFQSVALRLRPFEIYYKDRFYPDDRDRHSTAIYLVPVAEYRDQEVIVSEDEWNAMEVYSLEVVDGVRLIVKERHKYTPPGGFSYFPPKYWLIIGRLVDLCC